MSILPKNFCNMHIARRYAYCDRVHIASNTCASFPDFCNNRQFYVIYYYCVFLLLLRVRSQLRISPDRNFTSEQLLTSSRQSSEEPQY
jgi:hypothetical protein